MQVLFRTLQYIPQSRLLVALLVTWRTWCTLLRYTRKLALLLRWIHLLTHLLAHLLAHLLSHRMLLGCARAAISALLF